MKNIRYAFLVSNYHTLQQKLIHFRCPTPYLAENVSDFEENRHKLKSSLIQSLLPSPIFPNYAAIYLLNVRIDHVRDEDGDLISAINEFNQEADLFDLSDYSGKTRVLWPKNHPPYKSFSNIQLMQGLNFGDTLYLASLLYDLEHDNIFVYKVIKEYDNIKGTGKKKKLESFLESINPFPQLIPEKY